MQIDVGDLTGINTGYSDLKRITSGLQAGNLIIVGVHPEMGKGIYTERCLSCNEFRYSSWNHMIRQM